MKHKPIMAIAFLALTLLTGCTGGQTTTSETQPTKDYSSIAENPNISIPGYNTLSFRAGEQEQSVDFYNPKENTCWFRLTLVLQDGSEDGVTLWTSDRIEPEQRVERITLSQTLDSGDYPAVLKYECFSLKDESPLNGSDITLTLEVR